MDRHLQVRFSMNVSIGSFHEMITVRNCIISLTISFSFDSEIMTQFMMGKMIKFYK